MWVKVSQEEARQHPLFGVRGSLLFVGCVMVLLVMLSPVMQIIAKEMAGWHNTRFVPTVSTVIAVTITWGIFRRRAYVRAWAYSWAALTIVALTVLLFFETLPHLPVQVEDALIGLLIKDIPLCTYFTWSRRARVTLEGRVRSGDPLLSRRDGPSNQQTEATGTQNNALSGDSTTPAAGPADHKPSELRPGQHAEVQSGTPSQDKPQDDSGPQKKFELLLQYSHSVRDAYAVIGHLSEELKQRFEAAVIEPGRHNEADEIAAKLLQEHNKRMCPFDSAEANDLLAKARELGSAAEKEFMDVMELLGPSALQPKFSKDK